ncbi:hypothetical protein CEXT_146171 [Caerostris extrusa]|uniref:Uncharacterized protein n=1 Tax=Caerostris extrusa TaxID=172846 RepID=A0AAV4XMH5_CAEEX|nr:hypothetical protein CEXT_146171 [Caerostris extrusa]
MYALVLNVSLLPTGRAFLLAPAVQVPRGVGLVRGEDVLESPPLPPGGGRQAEAEAPGRRRRRTPSPWAGRPSSCPALRASIKTTWCTPSNHRTTASMIPDQDLLVQKEGSATAPVQTLLVARQCAVPEGTSPLGWKGKRDAAASSKGAVM